MDLNKFVPMEDEAELVEESLDLSKKKKLWGGKHYVLIDTAVLYPDQLDHSYESLFDLKFSRGV